MSLYRRGGVELEHTACLRVPRQESANFTVYSLLSVRLLEVAVIEIIGTDASLFVLFLIFLFAKVMVIGLGSQEQTLHIFYAWLLLPHELKVDLDGGSLLRYRRCLRRCATFWGGHLGAVLRVDL